MRSIPPIRMQESMQVNETLKDKNNNLFIEINSNIMRTAYMKD